MKKKHLVLTAATLSLAMALGACGSYAGAATSLAARSATEANAEHREGTVENTADATVISANGSDITVSGDGAVAADGTVTIQKAGTYVLRGNFAEGQLVADAEEGAEIKLVFDGFTISNSTNAPLVFESGVSVTIVLQDGTENAVSDLRNSAEDNKAAIYAKSDLTISGNGALAVQGNAEDAIHSEANVTVEGGTLTLKAGDDGIHADETLTVRNGNINVTESEEGLEGLVVDIQGGVITVTAKDDGINASDGSGSDAAPGQATEGAAVRISGGMVTVKAGGDGIDSNGDLTISGGTVVVDGPSDGGNAPLDYDGKGVITGGTVFVTGDSGMFQTLNDSGSTQKSLVVSLNSTQGAGTKVTIADSKGNVVYENTATTQAFNTLLFSAADLKQDENYTVTVGSESRTVTVSDSANINSENSGNLGAPGSKPEGRPNGQRPDGRPENGGQQDSRGQQGDRRNGRGERNGRPSNRGQQNGGAFEEDRDGEVRDDRSAVQRGEGNRPAGRPENGGQQGGRDRNGKRPAGRPENGGQQGNRGQNGNRPEGRPENGGQQGSRDRQNGNRPAGRSENGDRQGGRDRNGKRPAGRPENEGQQGGRGQNGKRPAGRPEDGGQQGGRGQNGKRPEGRPENGQQQGKQRGKRSVDDNDKSKGTCSCSADCSCRAK